MKNSREVTRKDTTAGDAAVDGLLAGGGAGLLMAAYLVVAGLAMGEAVGTVLGHFDPAQSGAPVVGALAHLALSGVYGAIFGLGGHVAPRGLRGRVPGWLAGLAYGLALWGLAAAVFLPGAASALRSIPSLHFAIAHLVYGLTLGVGLSMRRHE